MRYSCLIILLFVVGCNQAPTIDDAAITVDQLTAHIKTLSSDEFEGRGPSSAGEEKTVAYLEAEFGRRGLQPANGSSFRQNIPLVEITAIGNPELIVSRGSSLRTYAYGNDFMGWTKRVTESVSVENSDIVFVGYGIVAPEYGWDDYSGVDVKGKTVLILVNDPGYVSGDETFFKGTTMTYYGRWTYKYEEAARQGASAAIIVHETGPAGYPWSVVSSSWSGGQFDLVTADGNAGRVAIEGWVQRGVADEIFADAGLDYQAEASRAARAGFSAFEMGSWASVAIQSENKRSESTNVAAMLEGAVSPDEVVIYMGHWDHLGVGSPDATGDSIFNGARDNATGIAGLLEVAEFFAAGDRPARSILFLAVGVEESGLLGSKYYSEYPLYPLETTVVAINMDGLNIWGPMKDITIVGYGNSHLDDYVEEVVAASGRVVRPDPNPEKGFFFRSDHFSFAKKGVPSLYTENGVDHVDNGEEWTLAQMDEWTVNKYHAPGDEYDDTWDLTGAVADLQLLVEVGAKVANEASWVDWKEGSAFKATRDESRSQRSE